MFYKESVVTARQNQMLMTYASPTALDNYPLANPRRSLPSAVPSSACGRTLTVWVFIRQPVVLVAMQLVVRVPGVALVLSRVAVDVLALVPVAHLELVRGSHAGPASVGRSGEDAERGREKKASVSHFTGSEVGLGGTIRNYDGSGSISDTFPTLDCHSRVCETPLLRRRCESTGQTHSTGPSFHPAS